MEVSNELSVRLSSQGSREQQSPLPHDVFSTLASDLLEVPGVRYMLSVSATHAVVPDTSKDEPVVYRPQQLLVLAARGPHHAAVHWGPHRPRFQQSDLEPP